jgi:hypothetical protein
VRRISPLSTRVPVRVALPVARVAVRRVQGRYTVRKVPPRPRPSRASPSRCGSDPLKATRHIQASAQAVGRAGCPRHPYSHSGPRVTVALLRLPTRGLGGGGGVGRGLAAPPPPPGGGGAAGGVGREFSAPPSRPRGSEHPPAQGRLCGPCYTRSPTRARPGRGVSPRHRAHPSRSWVSRCQTLRRSRAPAGRCPCSRCARAARAAPPLPPVPKR